LNDHLLRRSSA